MEQYEQFAMMDPDLARRPSNPKPTLQLRDPRYHLHREWREPAVDRPVAAFDVLV
jgi:hypothetical protein